MYVIQFCFLKLSCLQDACQRGDVSVFGWKVKWLHFWWTTLTLFQKITSCLTVTKTRDRKLVALWASTEDQLTKLSLYVTAVVDMDRFIVTFLILSKMKWWQCWCWWRVPGEMMLYTRQFQNWMIQETLTHDLQNYLLKWQTSWPNSNDIKNVFVSRHWLLCSIQKLHFLCNCKPCLPPEQQLLPSGRETP